MKKSTLYCLMVVLVFISLSSITYAQQNQHRYGKGRSLEVTDAHITGHVIDDVTGEHIPFVNIQIKGSSIGTTTDESGHFFLRNLPLGEHTLLFSMVGYTSEERVVTVKENSTVELHVKMDEAS